MSAGTTQGLECGGGEDASGGYDLSERASHLGPGRHAKGVRLGIEVDLQKDRLKRWGDHGYRLRRVRDNGSQLAEYA